MLLAWPMMKMVCSSYSTEATGLLVTPSALPFDQARMSVGMASTCEIGLNNRKIIGRSRDTVIVSTTFRLNVPNTAEQEGG